MKDYELIYNLRKYNTNNLQSLTIQLQNKAAVEAKAIHKKYLDALKNALDTEDFEVSPHMCMADGIMNHVYTPSIGVQHGLGKRKCIFCGCDDFQEA